MTVARGPGRPTDRSAAQARSLLIAAARRRFAAEGYAASTRDICDDAGMQTGNLRHHFGSKAGLFHAVYDDAMATVASMLADAVDELGLGVGPGAFVRSVGALTESSPEVVEFLAVAPLERARHRELKLPLGDAPLALELLVRGAVARWSSDADEALADAVIAAVFGVLVYPAVIDPTLDHVVVIDAFAGLLDRSLA